MLKPNAIPKVTHDLDDSSHAYVDIRSKSIKYYCLQQ